MTSTSRTAAWLLAFCVLALPLAPRGQVVHQHGEHGDHAHVVGLLTPHGSCEHGHSHTHSHTHPHQDDGLPSDPTEPPPTDPEATEHLVELTACSSTMAAVHASGVRTPHALGAAAFPLAQMVELPWRPPIEGWTPTASSTGSGSLERLPAFLATTVLRL